MTAYAHDRGRLVSSQPEVEWDEQEQSWMLALRMHRSLLCPGCGGHLSVTTAPEHEDRFRAELPRQCFRCVAFGRSHEAYAEERYGRSLIHLVPQRPA